MRSVRLVACLSILTTFRVSRIFGIMWLESRLRARFGHSRTGVRCCLEHDAYRPSTALCKPRDRTRASARARGQCFGYCIHRGGDHWCGMAAVGMKSKCHAPLATLAGVQAFEADGTYQPPAIESGRWMMMATATLTATALIPIRMAQTP